MGMLIGRQQNQKKILTSKASQKQKKKKRRKKPNNGVIYVKVVNTDFSPKEFQNTYDSYAEGLLIYRKMYLIHDTLCSSFENACKYCDGKGTIIPVYVRMDCDDDLSSAFLNGSDQYFETSMDNIAAEFLEAVKNGEKISLAYTINSGPDKKHGKEIERLYDYIGLNIKPALLNHIAEKLGFIADRFSVHPNKIIYSNSFKDPEKELVFEVKIRNVSNPDFIEIKDAYLIPKEY
uniref:Uncharacterized protein n=1 Tax=Bacillus subtilis TaxID=1423 RepID=A0A1J0AKR8_BACIU|nr:hypothetical protein [Bacillus subtilis]APB62340.1 hypothetical protein pBS72_0710 [Bacillus subtilis]